MGYIMPVDRYQYINYQERFSSDRLSVSPVNSSFRTILERKHQEVSSEYDRLLPSSYKTIPLGPQNPSDTEQTFAEITGKGRNFNVSI